MYIIEMVCSITINTGNLEQNTEIQNHSMHQSVALHIQFCRISAFKKSTANIGIQLYIKLPSEMRKLEKIPHFGREL